MTPETIRHPSVDALAREIFDELRLHVEEHRPLAPVLFLHRFGTDDELELIDFSALDDVEQGDWAARIAADVEAGDASFWSLATQVVITRVGADRTRREEEQLLVCIIADAQSPHNARIWAAPMNADEGWLSEMQECTHDPRLQLMVSRLIPRTYLH